MRRPFQGDTGTALRSSELQRSHSQGEPAEPPQSPLALASYRFALLHRSPSLSVLSQRRSAALPPSGLAAILFLKPGHQWCEILHER